MNSTFPLRGLDTLFFLNIKACQTYLIQLNHVYFFLLTFLYRSLTQKIILRSWFNFVTTHSHILPEIPAQFEKKNLKKGDTTYCVDPFLTIETHFSILRNQTA